MNATAITQFITETFAGVDVLVASRENGAPEMAWGDSFFFYDPDRNRDPKQRMPFATIVTQDYGEFDCASNLNRPGVFRLNIGVNRPAFQKMFGSQAPLARAPGELDDGYDFSVLDQVLPHPVYAAQSWICVLNPSAETFETLKPLIAEAYDLAVSMHAKHTARG